MSRAKGFEAEKKAVEYLESLGFEIIECNFFSRYGEIDIIAMKGENLHFIEVKSGVNFNPIYAVTPKKIGKILKTIQYFIMKNAINLPYCIDVICIENDQISFIENVTF